MNSANTAPAAKAPKAKHFLSSPRALITFLSDIGNLASPVFRSKQRKSVLILFAVVVAFSLTYVQLTVILSYWRQDFFDAIEAKDVDAFKDLLLSWHADPKNGVFGIMPGFLGMALFAMLLNVEIYFLTQWLQMKGRTELTFIIMDEWLSDLSYYITGLIHGYGADGTENPDQRITEDVRDFIILLIQLSLGLIATIAIFFGFIFILWNASGPITIYDYTIPHYMVFAAVIYALVGTWATSWVGRPLPDLKNEKQRREADLRFALMRVRENAKEIALSDGGSVEKVKLHGLYDHLIGNWWNIMWNTKKLTGLTAAYGQAAVVFPYIVSAPAYFAGAITLGVLMQIATAFEKVQDSLSWFVDSYGELAELHAIVQRLMTLKRAMAEARVAHQNGIKIRASADGNLKLVDLKVNLPNQAPLLQIGAQTFEAGESTIIGGRSGCGKSTLFGAIAGIWPFGEGEIDRPQNSLFLPQHPYMPLGMLQGVVTYPHSADAYSREQILEALEAAGLGTIGHELDVVDNWSQRLSGGQQQRISIARAFLAKPDWLFLDEATAALDLQSEQEFFVTLKKCLPNTTIVSIGHRTEVMKFHQRHLVIQREVQPPTGPVGRMFDVTPVRGI